MAAVLPTSAEVIAGTQTAAQQKVALAATLDYLAENINKGTTAGTSTAYTVALVPPITALEAKQRHRLKIHVASGAAPTLAVDGLTAKLLKAYDSTGAKVAAVLTLNMLADVEYDGTDYVVLNPLPAAAASNGLSTLFTSAEFTIPSANTQTAAHGLGGQPTMIYSFLRCKTAELGYAVGDEVAWNAVLDSPGNSITATWADATNVGVTGSAGVRIANRTSPGTATAITAGNWRVVIRAWK